jgi:hypothetical protein
MDRNRIAWCSCSQQIEIRVTHHDPTTFLAAKIRVSYLHVGMHETV